MKHVLGIIAHKMLPRRHVSLHFPWYCRPCPCHWEAVGIPWAMYVVFSKNLLDRLNRVKNTDFSMKAY